MADAAGKWRGGLQNGKERNATETQRHTDEAAKLRVKNTTRKAVRIGTMVPILWRARGVYPDLFRKWQIQELSKRG